MPADETPSTTGSKKLTKKDKALLSIEDAYPGIFLPLTRANIVKVHQEAALNIDHVAYPYKDGEVSDEQYIKMKNDLSRELCKHFIAFGTNKGIGWAIKQLFPYLDCSTKVFKELRKYGLDTIRNYKHDFIYEKLYVSIFR